MSLNFKPYVCVQPTRCATSMALLKVKKTVQSVFQTAPLRKKGLVVVVVQVVVVVHVDVDVLLLGSGVIAVAFARELNQVTRGTHGREAEEEEVVGARFDGGVGESASLTLGRLAVAAARWVLGCWRTRSLPWGWKWAQALLCRWARGASSQMARWSCVATTRT